MTSLITHPRFLFSSLIFSTLFLLLNVFDHPHHHHHHRRHRHVAGGGMGGMGGMGGTITIYSISSSIPYLTVTVE